MRWKTPTLPLIVLLVAFLGLSQGCAGRGPVTTGEVWAFCMSSDNDGMNDRVQDDCGIKNDYCDALRKAVETKWEAAEDCARECEAVSKRFVVYPSAMSGACGKTFDTGRNWCVKFCRTNYPAGG